MGYPAAAWILGIGASLAAVALLFVVNAWLEACPRCKSWKRARTLSSHEPNPVEREYEMKCVECGHRWKTRFSYLN